MPDCQSSAQHTAERDWGHAIEVLMALLNLLECGRRIKCAGKTEHTHQLYLFRDAKLGPEDGEDVVLAPNWHGEKAALNEGEGIIEWTTVEIDKSKVYEECIGAEGWGRRLKRRLQADMKAACGDVVGVMRSAGVGRLSKAARSAQHRASELVVVSPNPRPVDAVVCPTPRVAMRAAKSHEVQFNESETGGNDVMPRIRGERIKKDYFHVGNTLSFTIHPGQSNSGNLIKAVLHALKMTPGPLWRLNRFVASFHVISIGLSSQSVSDQLTEERERKMDMTLCVVRRPCTLRFPCAGLPTINSLTFPRDDMSPPTTRPPAAADTELRKFRLQVQKLEQDCDALGIMPESATSLIPSSLPSSVISSYSGRATFWWRKFRNGNILSAAERHS
ncbi:hypothetical protein B0H16DRAFT_1841564 [Mycena metata]|uniref:Uncharacterized protein n=1 Tax=Mycena metata TaxID=1033252 RepID=A0AAD7IWE0_9AGAR|nr:hypothetical protein B0H16DRAFT_1841564 [Mycena metata]